MLWRETYSPRVKRDLACPVAQFVCLDGIPSSVSSEVWIGGFGFLAAADQGVWWRLFQSDFRGDDRVRRVFIVDKVGTADLETALSLVPGSEARRTFMIEDPNHFWKELVKPDCPERGFAVIMSEGKVPLLMIGTPTEEAWEEFSREWQLRT